MTKEAPPVQPNTLGNTSLYLGVVAICCVFSLVICAGVGQQQGWLRPLATLFFLIGVTFAFLGLVSAFLGFCGLFGRNRPRGTALAGFLLGGSAVVLFLAAVQRLQQ